MLKRRSNASRVQRFDNRGAQIALGLFGALIALIGFAMVFDASSGRVAGVLFFVLGGTFAGRAARTSAVEVDDSGLRLLSIFRTRTYKLSELRGVEVVVGRTGLNGHDRQYLVLSFTDGTEIAFKDFNSAPPSDGAPPSAVQRAAASIRRPLAAH